MSIQPSPALPLQTPWTVAKGYFVPPLVIPAAILLAVLLLALVRGPLS